MTRALMASKWLIITAVRVCVLGTRWIFNHFYNIHAYSFFGCLQMLVPERSLYRNRTAWPLAGLDRKMVFKTL